MDKECWRNIPGYDNYQVSTYGRIKQISNGPGIVTGRILRPDIAKNNYIFVRIYKNGDVKRFSIHRLVLSAFIGECPQNNECRHLDGNRQNNHLKNLRWGTHQDNVQDCKSHGNYKGFPGTHNPMSKLTEQQVRDIIKISRIGRNGNAEKKSHTNKSPIYLA